MAISNKLPSPLKGIGDPTQGFGFSALLRPSTGYQAPKPAPLMSLAKPLSPAPTTSRTSGLIPIANAQAPALSQKAESGFAMRDALYANKPQAPAPAVAQPAPVQRPPVIPNGQASTITPTTTPAINQPPQQGFQAPPGSSPYAQVTSQLSQFDPSKTPAFLQANQAYQQKVNELENLQKDYAEKTTQIQGRPGSNLTLAGGQQGLLNQQYLTSSAAAQQAVNQQQQAINQALTATGQQQSALTSAAGFAQPQLAGYNQQGFNPLTGQFGGGGNLTDVVGNVVQRLTNGTMTYNDALTALSGYGQGGINALQSALPPNFNIAQSNTLAGQQGSVGVNYSLADAALRNVESLMSQLAPLQQTNIPGVNALTQGFSTITGLGSEQTRAVTGAVQSLRNAYASLLAAARGGTPTDYSSQALAEIPDRPTPNDIAAIRKNFETLGAVRKDILGNPGQANAPTTNSTNIYSW